MEPQKSVAEEAELALAAVQSLREEVGKVFERHLSCLKENNRRSSELGDNRPLKNGTLTAPETVSAYEEVKVFSLRESPLTVLLKTAHIQTIYNICLASVTLLGMNLIVQELSIGGSVKPEVDLLCWFFGKFSSAFTMWTLMFSNVVFFVYPSYYVWSRFSTPLDWRTYVATLGYLVWLCAFIYLPIHFVRELDLPIGTCALVICEQVRLIMKVHSFVRENYSRNMEHERRLCGQDQNEKAIRRPCPTFKNFVYFLFAPTLIYRNVYPRTPRVRWGLVAKYVLEIVACTFYSHHLFVHFSLPLFKNFSRDQVSWSSFLLSAFGCILPASVSYVLTFYAVLHSWMNAFAEMLRFGDRMFYMDWWNCTTMPSFYRKWNCIVYDWLHAYVYVDICALLGSNWKPTATMAVFFLSAAAHEYILTMSLQFFVPMLFVIFFFISGPGAMLLMRSTRSAKWNFCLWLMIMVGTGMLYSTYCREWYARKNCHCVYKNLLDHLTPCSWTCSSASMVATGQG